jgi:hypothetical protein
MFTMFYSGVGVDVFCTGSSELGFPVYQALVEASSGYVLSHDTFASSRLAYNLGYIIQKTHISQPFYHDQKEDVKVELPQNSRAIDRPMIIGFTIDIRMSRYD